MENIDRDTVQFNKVEMSIHDHYERLLDEGFNIPEAALIVLDNHPGATGVSDDFIQWLSEDTVAMKGLHPQLTPKGAALTEGA